MHRRFKFFLFVFLLSVCINCSQNKSSNAENNFPVKPLVIPGDNGDDWGDGDFVLSITSIAENDTGKMFKAVSSYKNEEVGMLIIVPKSKNEKNGFGNNIILKSIGKPSDRLLLLMAQLYKQKLSPDSKFVSSISIGYVNLGEFAKSLGGTPESNSNTTEFKLFFTNKNDEAELYLNIKSGKRIVEIKEKDQEYRPTIIQMLKAP